MSNHYGREYSGKPTPGPDPKPPESWVAPMGPREKHPPMSNKVMAPDGRATTARGWMLWCLEAERERDKHRAELRRLKVTMRLATEANNNVDEDAK
jgi:hypothetical protein